MLKYLVEFIGTFILLIVILNKGEAIPIGIALAAAIYMGGGISGGHFNPVVSTIMFMKKNIDFTNYSGYIVSQLLGGIGALYLHKQTIKA